MYGFYYHAGKSWEDVRLWEATKDNEVFDVKIDEFITSDNYWNIGSFKDLAEEMKLVLKADYNYPIIIDEENRLIDGAHRIVHAYLDGIESIKAVIIGNDQWPEPDYDEAKEVREAKEEADARKYVKKGKNKQFPYEFKVGHIIGWCVSEEKAIESVKKLLKNGGKLT